MDAETAKELIALIDSKIVRLQQSKKEILELAAKNKGQIDLIMPDIPSVHTSNGASETTKQVYEVLLATGKILSPKELFDELKDKGFNIPDSRVRQVLMRWKNRLFKTPRRGQWKAIKQEK